MRLFWSGRIGKGVRIGTSVPLTGSGKPTGGGPTGLAVFIIVAVVVACAVGGGLCGWAVAAS